MGLFKRHPLGDHGSSAAGEARPRCMPSEKWSPSTSIRTFKIREGVVQSLARSRATAGSVRTAFADAQKPGAAPVRGFEIRPVESFETGCIKLAGTLLPQLEKKGLRRVVTVVKSPGVRMATRAVAMAAHVEIKVVESRLQAAA